MRLPPLLSVLMIAALPAAAQAPMALPSVPPGSPDPARVAAGSYAIEPAHTEVMFAVDHLGFSIFRGLLSGASGKLVIDPRNPTAAKLTITIPVDSIYTPSKDLNAELVGAQFFDVQHWPNATFVSTSIVPAAEGWTLVNGNLTIHGQTRAAQIKVRLHGAGKSMIGKGQSIGFDGRLAINRSEYGVGAGVPLVSDQVQITIAAAFEQQ